MPLTFPDLPLKLDKNRKLVCFAASDGAVDVQCWVSHEALADHCGLESGAAENPIGTFTKHRLRIQAAASDKYDRGGCEADGSILLRSEDL